MSEDLKTYNQLKAYLAGKLGSDEKETFEQLLHSTEGKEWLRVHGAIEAAGDQYYRDKFLSLHEEMKPVYLRRKRLIWTSFAVAALVLLLLLLRGNLFSTKNPASLYAENFDPGTSFSRSLEEAQLSPQEIIGTLSGNTSRTAIENRSLGIAYMRTEQFALAIQTLDPIGYDSFLKDEAVWLQALAALKLSQLDAAQNYLRELIEKPENENSSFKPKALKLLQEIQELESR